MRLTCSAHLRPGGGVPLEARPLEAGVFILRLLAASARLLVEGLELPSADADAHDHPPLHATPTGGVALWVGTSTVTDTHTTEGQ